MYSIFITDIQLLESDNKLLKNNNMFHVRQPLFHKTKQ